MEYSESKNRVEISSKIFKDDFRLVLFHLFEKDIDIDNPKLLEQDVELIQKYYLSHLIINQGNENCTLYRKGIKADEEYIQFHYYFELQNDSSQLEIVNTILLDLYFDQKNMLIFGSNTKEKGYLFNIRETKHKIKLDEF
jgi:hypothetical protein